MYCTFILKLAAVIVQLQSGWDSFETFVVLGESSTPSGGGSVYTYIHIYKRSVTWASRLVALPSDSAISNCIFVFCFMCSQTRLDLLLPHLGLALAPKYSLAHRRQK